MSKTIKFLRSIPLIFSIVLLFAAPVASGQDYDELIQQGLSLRNNGDFPAAETTFRQAYDLATNKSEAIFLLSTTIAFQERYEEAELLIAEGLQQYPDYIDLSIAQARVAGFQSQFQRAISILQPLQGQHQDNLDLQILLGRMYLFDSQLLNSIETFQSALDLEQNNIEVLIGLYDAHLSMGNRATAESFLNNARNLAPENDQVSLRVSRMDAPMNTVQRTLTVSHGDSGFDIPNFNNWYDSVMEYQHISENGNRTNLRIEDANRFGKDDTLAEIGFSFANLPFAPLEFSAGFTPDSDFLPSYRARIGTNFRLASGDNGTTLMNVRLQQAKYSTGSTQNINLGLEHYLPALPIWLTPSIGYSNDEDDENDFTWSIGAHAQIGPRSIIGVNYYDAPETENNVTTDTQTSHIYWRYQLSNQFQLRMDYSESDRQDAYIRDSFTISLSYRLQ